MKSLNEIRKDLRDIRYYYARKDMFDESFSNTGDNCILQTVKLYNAAVCAASPRLYELYVELYLKNKSQASVASEHGFTVEYVQRLHTKLIKLIQNQLSKIGGAA